MKNHSSLLPAACHSNVATSAAKFTLTVRSTNRIYFNIVKTLDCSGDLRLIRFLVNLECISIVLARKMHPLLGHQRFNYNIMIIHGYYSLIPLFSLD